MQQYQRKLTLRNVQWHTSSQRRRVEETTRRAQLYATDPYRSLRRDASKCLVCYYGESGIGGAAITTTNCRACNTEIVFGSTNTDALCETCAKHLRLCRHCGSDLDLKTRRTIAFDKVAEVTPFEQPTPPSSWERPILLLPKKEEQ